VEEEIRKSETRDQRSEIRKALVSLISNLAIRWPETGDQSAEIGRAFAVLISNLGMNNLVTGNQKNLPDLRSLVSDLFCPDLSLP
jgi:hypothetical protein